MIVLYTQDMKTVPKVEAKRLIELPNRADAEDARRRIEHATGRPVFMLTHEPELVR